MKGPVDRLPARNEHPLPQHMRLLAVQEEDQGVRSLADAGHRRAALGAAAVAQDPKAAAAAAAAELRSRGRLQQSKIGSSIVAQCLSQWKHARRSMHGR